MRFSDLASCFDSLALVSVDFEQPRALWSKVWNDAARAAYVQNVAGHFGGVKSPEIKARQRASIISVATPNTDRACSVGLGCG